MSTACSISRRLTSFPPGPVWCVTRFMPRIFWAVSRAAAAPLTTFTPPPLPRPPAWICALTTTNSLSVSAISAFAAPSASSMLNTGRPLGIGTPNFFRISFAWYSWIFTRSRAFLLFQLAPLKLARGLQHFADGPRRFVSRRLFVRRQLERDDLLDATGADHERRQGRCRRAGRG